MQYYAIYSKRKPIAMIMVLLKKIPLLGYAIRINRGPIILENCDNSHYQISFESLQLIIEESKKRKWIVLQIAPEIPYDKILMKNLLSLGFRKLNSTPWASGLLSLDKSEEEILMSFKGRWRRSLRKGLKQNISISLIKNTEENIDNFINHYKQYKKEKSFEGISTLQLKAMLYQKNKNFWIFNIFQANLINSNKEKQILGYLCSLNFGDTSIYLIGTRTSLGKKFNTNYLLMWEAIIEARRNNCEWFDIGGLNEQTTKGIAQFKSGLNSQYYKLIGEWRKFIFPSF